MKSSCEASSEEVIEYVREMSVECQGVAMLSHCSWPCVAFGQFISASLINPIDSFSHVRAPSVHVGDSETEAE